ncbi:MAG TPA: GTPase [Pirellulales bacterium]|nr:GTPase [Pirellulales bacterium]
MLTVTVLTPAGRAAVAVLAVSGHGADAKVGQLFSPASGRPLVEAAVGQIVLGRWAGAVGEELVVCRRAMDEVEIHCHGGAAAVATVVDSLVEGGCRQSQWPEWVSLRSGNPIAADAIVALARATTRRSAAVLLDQFHGALAAELESCAELLESSEEASHRAAETRLRSLAARSQIGRHLIDPFRVVIAGKPNVGKSSLVNALAGFERSIVYDQPGTTRDVVTARTAIDGWPVELSDTAGLRTSDDALEEAGVRLALDRIRTADARLLVFDSSQPWSQSDDELIARWPDSIVVHNKADLRPPPVTIPGGVVTSAVSGQGIDTLLSVLGERLVPRPVSPGEPIPFLALHEEVIGKSIEQLLRGEFVAAAKGLRDLCRRQR